jgi:peptidoglycan hydrolase-like protein with peptidoglycan-binding domain
VSKTDLSCSDPWLASQRRSRTRRAEAVRRLRRLRGRRSGLAVLGASLVLAGGAMAETTSTSATKARAVAPGVDVASVQRALGISADGIVGPQTRRAIRSFQRANGLVVDGVVGPQTLGALGLSTSSVKAQGSSNDAALLARIAECESGGDPTIVSPDGRYRGKYQFSRATWRAMGGSGDPAQAPEAEQDRLAAALLAARGTSPWPNCA